MNDIYSSKSSMLLKKVIRKVSPALRDDLQLLDLVRDTVVPIAPSQPDPVSCVPQTLLGSKGIDFHDDEQLARVSAWTGERYQAFFRELRDDRSLRIDNSGLYQTPDAEIYAAMILDRKPRRIIEVGAGYSTLIARKTIRHAGYDTKLIAIDPMPRTDVKAAADELILNVIERSDLINYDWSAEDILFIDSSHVCRIRGDLPYLYCQLLPSLPAGILVHVHDIFLPFDYPNVFDGGLATEQYLVSCMLAYSPRYHTVMSTHRMTREHLAPMQAAFGAKVGDPAAEHFFGCSYWFEVRD
jgi:hypothetical protein